MSSDRASDENNKERHTQAATPSQDLGHDSSTRSGEKVAPKSSRKLPPILDHLNARDLKTLLRCSIAFWVACLLIFIHPALNAIGAATFFAAIVVLFLPPAGVILVFLLGAATMVIGVCLGWAWGVISMKAAMAARPASDTNARLAALVQEVKSTGTSSSVLVYNGFMLDTRVTITYFCMLGLFVYFMARLRIRVPKLQLTTIFAWIITDVFITVGPLLPSFNGTLPKSLVIPAACAVAINLACALLIFPESTSHMALYGMHKLGTAISSTLSLTRHGLDDFPADNTANLEAMRAAMFGGYAALDPVLTFLPFDLSFGYWSAEDIVSLRKPLRHVLVRALSLLDFQLLQARQMRRMDDLLAKAEEEHMPLNEKNEVGKHQIMESLKLVQGMRQPEAEQSVTESYRSLSKASAPLLDAMQAAMDALLDGMQQCNTRRWFNVMSADDMQSMHQRHVAALEALQTAKGQYPILANNALLESHDHLFDATGELINHDKSALKLTGLFVGFNLEDHLIKLADSLDRALCHVTALEHERTKRRVWAPTGLRHLGAWIFGASPTPALKVPGMDGISEPDEATLKEMADRFKKISRPVKQRNKVSACILGFSQWFSSEEGVFGLRVVLGTFAIGVIAATTPTAGFFYREKGLWALIMVQTGMMPHVADFTSAFIFRMIGTVGGGVIGMVGWYIGSGSGPGNPYGLAAVMAVLSVVIMWLRLFAAPRDLQTVMLMGATILLVVGYSYIDTHNPTYGNPGRGAEVFWRRTVLVLVGFGVSFLVSLIPWPSSQSRFIARSLSKVLHAHADHYALLLASWRDLETDERFLPAVELVAIHLGETLADLNGPIANLRFEFSSSPFDRATCEQIKALLDLINQCLARVHIRAVALPAPLRQRFAQISGLLDHAAIGDLMAVMAVVELSLKTGDPLPSRLPTPLLRGSLVHSRSTAVETVTKDLLRDPDYRGYCVTMSAYLGFLGAVDELVLVLKGALGESHFVPEELSWE